jgi:hypothetical protein
MALSTTFKTIASVALLSIIFAGCSATIPKAVNNKSLSDNYLYAILNKDYKIKEFSNQSNIGRGFIVNNYQPFGFKNQFYNTSYKGGRSQVELGGCLWNKHGKTYSKYETIEESMDPMQFMTNVMGLPLLLPLGFICSNYHAFNYEYFDKDIKGLLPSSSQQKLISNYDSLINTEHVKENEINEQINKLNGNSLQKLQSIKERYIAIDTNKIIKKIKIVDKTGLYKKEKLPEKINIYKNNFPTPTLLQEINYMESVNNSFPCNTVQRCISNMNNSRTSIEHKYQNDLKLISEQHNRYLQKDLKVYTDLNKFYNLKNDLNESSIEVTKNGIKKNIFYTIDIKSNELPINRKLLYFLTVTQVNYSDVFPKYKNKDKNIEIVFSPQTKSYKLINNTNKFIQIKSISLYYGESIYNLTLSKDNNIIATELSPQGTKIFKLYDDIKESSYEHITKRQAQAKNFRFGFAIKYTLGEQTKNITLFNQHNYNLYSLIKDI